MENTHNKKSFLCARFTGFIFLFIYSIIDILKLLEVHPIFIEVIYYTFDLIIYLIVIILVNIGIIKNYYKCYRYGLILSTTSISFRTGFFIGLFLTSKSNLFEINESSIIFYISLIIDWILPVVLIIYNEEVKDEIELNTSELLTKNENEPIENNNNEENNSPEENNNNEENNSPEP